MSNMVQSYKIPESFVLENLVTFIQQRFQPAGYMISVNSVGNAVQVTLQKNIGGIHMVTGLGEQLTVNFAVKENALNVFSSNQYWNDKIVAGVVGVFCCAGITWITAAIGIFKQTQLPNDVNATIFTYISSL
jgi:hypothetical protein